MKLLHKLKFIFKLLKIKEADYNLITWKSNCYDSMMKCVQITDKAEMNDTGNDNDLVFIRFVREIKTVVFINIIDMLKAGGVIFNKQVEFNINVKQD